MARMVKVSIAQFDVRKGNPRANWTKAQEVINEAKRQGAHMVVLPELWDAGYALDNAKNLASPLGGGLFSQVAALSNQLNIFIFGSMLEKRGLGVANSAAVISPSSGVMGAYRKIHLFPLMEEDQWMTPGEATLVVDLPWGATAFAICYDLRFPELFRRYAMEGAIMTILPSQWPHPRLDHFRTLVRARAIENQMYMIAVNRIGKDDVNKETGEYGQHFFGHSMIVDPNGEVLIELGEQEGVYTISLDTELPDLIRNNIPVLQNVRPEHYNY